MSEQMSLPLSGREDSQETEPILSVSQVNRLARQCLEEITVKVLGEVSGLRKNYPYFVYFDLRDEEAVLPAIMAKSEFLQLDFDLEDGATVVVKGNLSIYEKQGKYQVRVEEMSPFGEGDLRRRIEALKRKLHTEGIFDDARKKALPRFPTRIGVVSSPRGAAVRDVVKTINRRFPPAHVFIRGVRVQGEGAVEEICSALRFFNSEFDVEVIILARGGGSIQDMEPFNSEEVARTIAAMSVPVITGVGHEPDVSIADLVADRRASTPTAAAEAAVPEKKEIDAFLKKSTGALLEFSTSRISFCERHLNSIRNRPLYRSYAFLLGPFMQRLESCSRRLYESPRRGLAKSQNRLELVSKNPIYRKPDMLLAPWRTRLWALRSRISKAKGPVFESKKSVLEAAKARCEALSPLSILERGYSIVFKKSSGEIIRSSQQTEVGEELNIRLGEGRLDANVTGKE